MKIIINSRKYKLDKQFEMLDLGSPDDFETIEETLKAIEVLDKTAEEYKEKLNKCCDAFPECSHSQPIKEGDPEPKRTTPF